MFYSSALTMHEASGVPDGGFEFTGVEVVLISFYSFIFYYFYTADNV